ncbi:MAG: hypothetical protein KatS3mg109_1323 [Pirellulaceae bacterium]|nr:MAG: hypothetical protein KatS3mg109_1323 [Pirellulaceae bacterium]
MTNKAKGKREKSPLAVIRKAVEAAKKAGYTIVCGDWGVEWDESAKRWVSPSKCCCPLGAVLLLHQPNRVCDSYVESLAKHLEVSGGWIVGFFAAIDREPFPFGSRLTDKERRAGYGAGLTLRKKLGRMRRFDTASLLFAKKNEK